MATYDVFKLFQFYDDIRVKRIEIIYTNHPSRHVPFMLPSTLILGSNIRLWLVIITKGSCTCADDAALMANALKTHWERVFQAPAVDFDIMRQWLAALGPASASSPALR